MAPKTAFFTELFKLDEDEEETEHPEEAAVILKQFKPLRQPPRSEERTFLGRKISAPLPNASPVEASSSLIQSPPELLRRPSCVDVSSRGRPVEMVKPAKAPPKKMGKRKRGEPLELLPDSQQIFKGLEFCMIVQ